MTYIIQNRIVRICYNDRDFPADKPYQLNNNRKNRMIMIPTREQFKELMTFIKKAQGEAKRRVNKTEELIGVKPE